MFRTGLAAVAGVVVVTIGILFLILWAAGIGVFSTNVQAHVAKATLNPNVTIQVFNANNKIQSQGYFESLNADYQGFIAKIEIEKALIKSDNSAFNQTNLAGLRQECVDTAEKFTGYLS
jgi:hypothetical protein